MRTYADTSFLFSLYTTDDHSERAEAWRNANPAPLPFTALHRLELRDALSLSLFQEQIVLPQVQAVWQGVQNDCAAGLLVERDGLWQRLLTDAEISTRINSLSKPYGKSWQRLLTDAEISAPDHAPGIGCRTLGILHVAFAKFIGVTEFCTFDVRQSNLASRVGLIAVSP